MICTAASPEGIPTIFNKIRVQAIARKKIRQGEDFQQIQNNLLADNYFQEQKARLSADRANELSRNILVKALGKENCVAREKINNLFNKLL